MLSLSLLIMEQYYYQVFKYLDLTY
jgi:hypothetical protein